MSKRDNTLLLNDIIECANKIIAYIGTMNYEQFVADSKTIDAVIRNFEIIGEATNRITD